MAASAREPETDRQHEDPGLLACLSLVERDMAAHPERIKALSIDSLSRAQALVGDHEVDMHEDPGSDIPLGSAV
jgi:hypothetical protein